jgi:hypothetical protein
MNAGQATLITAEFGAMLMCAAVCVLVTHALAGHGARPANSQHGGAFRAGAAVVRRGLGLESGAALGVTGGTAAFLRDVGDGMDEHLARHPGRPGHTLEGQQARGRPQSEPHGARTYTGIDYAKDGR